MAQHEATQNSPCLIQNSPFPKLICFHEVSLADFGLMHGLMFDRKQTVCDLSQTQKSTKKPTS
jgi:hypothetical protein